MEKNQEEQARQMKELQERAEHLQRENDRLRSQVEKRLELDERDAQDSGQAKHQVIRDKEKKPIALDNVDTLIDNELSLGNSPNPSPSKSKSKAKIDLTGDIHIALHLTILMVAHSTRQRVGVRINQTKHPGTHLLYLQAQCPCNRFTLSSE